MQVKLREIGNLFSPNSQWTMDKCEENESQVNIEFTLGTCSVYSPLLNEEPDFLLNDRDEISVGYFEDEVVIAQYYPAQDKNWETFIAELRGEASADNARVVVNIAKRFVDNRVSVYLYDIFGNYIASKNFANILL